MVRWLLLSVIFALYACTSSDSANLPGTGTQNFLNTLGFTSNVLQQSPRLVAYSKKANRVSVIDPVQKTEIWGREARDFNFAIKLPSLDGAALFGNDRVVVMTENSDRSFTVNREFLHTDSAKNTAAYSLSSTDGATLELVRSLGNGGWQHETFAMPWGVIDPAVDAPPRGQPVLLASYFNNAGTMLAVFSPSDGRYAIYTAASASEPITNTTDWCAGDGLGSPQDASYRSISWDEDLRLFYIGDKNGRVYVVDPFAPCAALSSVITLDLPDTIPVAQLTIHGSGRFAAIQDEPGQRGNLYTVSFDGSALTIELQRYPSVCESPLGSLLLGTSYMVVLCTTDSALRENAQQDSPSGAAYVEPRQYLVMDSSTGEVIYQNTVDAELSAGVALDQDNAILYRMKEGAFGSLVTTNLLTGAREETTGLYIDGLLD